MNNLLRMINVDVAAMGLITAAAVGVLCEAATRTSLGDAQNARECRYPPLSSIVTRAHIRELEKNNVVVINNVLSPSTLHYARARAEMLGSIMEPSPNDVDVRQDVIISIKEDDEYDHGDAMVHCMRLLRGLPHLLDRFDYATSVRHVVPRQCQLALYRPDGTSAYVRHLDRCNMPLVEMGLLGWLRASDYRHRVVTAILYLNSPDWTGGGELRLFDGSVDDDDDDGENDEKDGGDDGKYLDIVPSGGKLILFDSSRVEHQVLASHGEDRYALTCWFNGDLVGETE